MPITQPSRLRSKRAIGIVVLVAVVIALLLPAKGSVVADFAYEQTIGVAIPTNAHPRDYLDITDAIKARFDSDAQFIYEDIRTDAIGSVNRFSRDRGDTIQIVDISITGLRYYVEIISDTRVRFLFTFENERRVLLNVYVTRTMI